MKIKDLLADRKLKYGGYATLLSAIVIALLVVVNILVDQVPAKADLTRQKFFSLSDQTMAILESLEQEVTIYSLYELGKEPDFLSEILHKYAGVSKNVKLKQVDPFRNPAFMNLFTTTDQKPTENSLIVEARGKHKVIRQSELFVFSPSRRNDPYSPQQPQALKAEQKISGAILFVTTKKNPVVYVLQGHEEEGLPVDIRKQLEDATYTLKDLNLLTTGSIPEDADILLIISPKRDLSLSEEQAIRAYLQDHSGHGLFLLDYLGEERELSRFHHVLKSYGVATKRMIVFEGDPEFHLPRLNIGLIPRVASHPITSRLKENSLYVLIPRSQAIESIEPRRRSIEVEPLLTSSEKSYGKMRFDAGVIERQAEDPAGPFDLAVAITDKGEEESLDSRLVIMASSFLLYPERAVGMPITGSGNTDFMLNSINWLYGQRELISIRGKSLLMQPLRLNQVRFYLYAGISVVIIPLCILGLGLGIWLRRRHL